jgi:hypothetical protein
MLDRSLQAITHSWRLDLMHWLLPDQLVVGRCRREALSPLHTSMSDFTLPRLAHGLADTFTILRRGAI